MRVDIAERTGWYQEIEIGGVRTARNPLSNVDSWRRIRTLMGDLKDKRVLDVGCNAGLFSVLAALEGASVVGLDNNQKWLDQALFVKNYFTLVKNKELDIAYILHDVSEDPLSIFGFFDYILLLGIAAETRLSHGEKKYSASNMAAQNRLITNLTMISDNIILRARDRFEGMSVDRYDEIFEDLGWKRAAPLIGEYDGVCLALYFNGR